jgi:hypothetical protein
MKTPIKKILAILILLTPFYFMSSAHAQADRIGNGGDWNEADLKHFLSRLSPYLESDEGKATFPEIVKYDQEHKDETIEKIISELNPHVVNQPVFDSKKK